jgi:hypothetical protein
VKKTRLIVCSFSSGLDELGPRQRRSVPTVLRVLARLEPKRYSMFEATANPHIARTMIMICREELIRTTGGAFPWTGYTITAKGRKALARLNRRDTEERR